MANVRPLSDAALAAGVFLAAAVLLAIGMDHNLIVYDEGLILLGATRVAHGAVIHRDFYANYGPGQFYVLAALFKLFGPSVIIERLWDTAVRAAIAALAFHLAARTMSRREGVLAAGLCAVWLLAFGYNGFPVFPALLFALAGLACLVPLFEGRGTLRQLPGCGVALGIATLFRYDVGFYAYVALSGIVLAHGLSRSRRRFDVVRELVGLGAGLALVCVPVAILYIVHGVAGDFVTDIIDYPAKYYWRMRSLPFPRLNALLVNPGDAGVYLPPGVWLMALFAAIVRQRTKPAASARDWIIAALVVLSALFYLKGLVRVSTIHMALSIVPALIAAALLASLGRDHAARQGVAWPLAVAAIIALVGFALPTLIAVRIDVAAIKQGIEWAWRASTWAPASAVTSPELAPCHPKAGLGRMACFATQDARADAILYVETHTRPGDFIFVGLDRHDRVFANDNLFYFLADRRPATKYAHIDPGLQTRADIQTIMVDELKARKPRFVVRDAEFSGVSEANQSSMSSGVHLLDAYLRATYRPVKTVGPFTILEPMPSATF